MKSLITNSIVLRAIIIVKIVGGLLRYLLASKWQMVKI